MYCRKCGKEINDDALFCPCCGTKKLHETEELTTSENSNSQVASGSKVRKKKNIVIIGIIIILIIAIFIGVMVSSNKHEVGYYTVQLNIYNFQDYLTVVRINSDYASGKYDLYIDSKASDAVFENVRFQTAYWSPQYDYVLPESGELTIRGLIDSRTLQEKMNDGQWFNPEFKTIEGTVKIPKKRK